MTITPIHTSNHTHEDASDAPVRPSHTDTLLSVDGRHADGAREMLLAELEWAEYTRATRLDVKAFFTGSAVKGLALHRAPSTWRKVTANARTLLAWLESYEYDTGECDDDGSPIVAPKGKGLARATDALDAWNTERVANGDRVTYSLAGILDAVKGPRVKSDDSQVDQDAPSLAEAEAAADPTPLVDVTIANLAHLSFEELHRVVSAANDILRTATVRAA